MKRYNVEVIGPSTEGDDVQVKWLDFQELTVTLLMLNDGDDAVVHCVDGGEGEI